MNTELERARLEIDALLEKGFNVLIKGGRIIASPGTDGDLFVGGGKGNLSIAADDPSSGRDPIRFAGLRYDP